MTSRSVVLVVAFMLGSCGFSATDMMPHTPSQVKLVETPTAASTTATLPTETPGVTSMPSLATVTPFTEATPQSQYKVRCLEIMPELPADAQVSGTLVFSGYRYSLPSRSYYLLDLASGSQIDLFTSAPGNDVVSAHVSEDGRLLAYKDQGYREPGIAGDSTLRIVAADGQPRYSLAWDRSWRHIASWLGNDRLIISQRRGDELRDSLLVIEISTGQQLLELLPDYPNLAAWYPEPSWAWYNASQTIYDPTLRRVVYPSLTDTGDVQLILWDLETNQSVVTITGTVSFGVTPNWSPDGRRLIISGPASLLADEYIPDPLVEHQELFEVGIDSSIHRLTHLTNVYTTYVRFDDYSWSPDGRYVALTLTAAPASYPDQYATTQPHISRRLVVLDTFTKEFIDFCIPRGASKEIPVWSPDGRQIAVEDYFQSNPPFQSKVYVIDLFERYAAHVAENVTPVGWMISGP